MPDARLVVLLPVHDDWESASRLLAELAGLSVKLQRRFHVLLVDDGSIEEPTDDQLIATQSCGLPVTLVTLRQNMGHQRAIGVGLCHVWSELHAEAVLIMDSDGEDDPAEIPALLKRFGETGQQAVVFAERTRRSEGMVFYIGYVSYRLLHRVLTGVGVRFGNFSVVPFSMLERLVANADLWNHYAASVVASRIPFTSVPTRRAIRYAGVSRMNLVALVTHGLSAISVFGERVGTRLLVMLAGAVTVTLGALGAILAIRLGTTLAIPGWATSAFGLIVVVLLQLLLFASIAVLALLRGRHSAGVIPLRDYKYFIRDVRLIATGSL